MRCFSCCKQGGWPLGCMLQGCIQFRFTPPPLCLGQIKFCLTSVWDEALRSFLSSVSIRFILMRIRIRGSASGITDNDLKSNKFQFFLRIFFCKRFKTHNYAFFFVISAYYLRILNKISDLKKKNYVLIILVDLYVSLSRFFFTTWIKINVS